MNLLHLFRSAAAVVVVAAAERDSMPFYGANVLVILIFVDLPSVTRPAFVVRLLVEGEVGHLAVAKVDCGTMIEKGNERRWMVKEGQRYMKLLLHSGCW